MKRLIRDYSRVMTGAHDDRGTTVIFKCDTRDSHNIILNFIFVSECIDKYWSCCITGNRNLSKICNRSALSDTDSGYGATRYWQTSHLTRR